MHIQEMNKNRGTVENTITIGITVFGILAAIMPLMQPGVYESTDGLYHISRAEGIYLDLIEGIFPAKIHLAAASGYGYGNGFFYPDFFLYVPAFLMILGMSLELSWKVYNILVMLAAYITMGYSIRRMDRSVPLFLCATGAAFYIMSWRFIDHIYGTESIGSATSMIFIPLAIVELVSILWSEHDRWDLFRFTLSACGMVLSHLSTALIIIVFLALICVLSIRQMLLRPRVIVELILCTLCGALLTIAFWLPMFEQLTVQQYKFQTSPLYLVSEHTVSVANMSTTFGIATTVILIAAMAYLIVIYAMWHKQNWGGYRKRYRTHLRSDDCKCR